MSFMEMVKNSYKKVSKQVKENPRICEICGKKENMHDLILKYDNGKYMCDKCAFAYYENEDNADKK